MRQSRRANDEKRQVVLERSYAKHAEGSCLVKFGDTHVLCTASVDERVPGFLKGRKSGWVTAEYAMLPRSTNTRTNRDGRGIGLSGRTQEIQRLIGRALRCVTDLQKLGERQIVIDCDVLQADGGTRTAAITGGWIALYDCVEWLRARDMIAETVLKDHIAAISCGVVAGEPLLDLDYSEDFGAEADANFVMSGAGAIVEIQATAETAPLEEARYTAMFELARRGIAELVDLQKMAIGRM